MMVHYGTGYCVEVKGDVSISDDDDFRLSIWEEDGVLHVYAREPIVFEGKTERVLR